MGVLLNGTTQYVTIADETSFDWERTQAFSGAAWIYLPTNLGFAAFGKGETAGGAQRGWACNTAATAGPVLYFHLVNDNTITNEIKVYGPDGATPTGLFQKTWVHIGFSYDGSSTVAGCKLYIAGFEVTTGAGTNANFDGLSATILNNTEVHCGFQPPTEFWNGAIADLVLTDSVLPGSAFTALADLANFGKHRPTLLATALDLWTPLRAVDALQDDSGSGHNGTATGSPTTFVGPTIALDAASGLSLTTTNSWTHTPRGVPRGVLVSIAQNTSGADRISGVTYGGVAMTRVVAASDGAGEPGAAYQYFLGAGIPTGAQTIEVTVSTGAEVKQCQALSFIAAGDTRIAASGSTSGDLTDPSVTLATLSDFEGQCVGVVYSGQNAPSAIATGSGYQIFGSADFGSQSCKFQYGQKSGASVACGFTIAVEDVALVACAIEAILPPAAEGTMVRQAVNRGASW